MTLEQKNKRVFLQPQVKPRAQIHSDGTHFGSLCLLPLAFTYLHPPILPGGDTWANQKGLGHKPTKSQQKKNLPSP